MLGWLVHEQGIDRTSPSSTSLSAATAPSADQPSPYDPDADAYTCPAGKQLRQRQKVYRSPPPLVDADGMLRYHRASKHDCDACALKPRCCPNASARKIPRSIHEGARRWRATSAPRRRAVPRGGSARRSRCCLPTSADPEAGSASLRGRMEPENEFHLAAVAQNLRKLAKLIPLGSRA